MTIRAKMLLAGLAALLLTLTVAAAMPLTGKAHSVAYMSIKFQPETTRYNGS